MAKKPQHVASLPTGVKVVVTTITPEAAQRLLRENSHNRPLNSRRVRRLATIIREGRWRLNGDTLKVDKKSRLLDGQHRLHAVIQADRPIQTLLVTGLDPAVFDTIDQGKARTGGDIFHICGVRNPSVVSSALTIVHQQQKGIPEGSSGWLMPDMDEKVRLFDKLTGFEDRVAEVMHYKNSLPGVPLSMFSGFYYVFHTRSRTAAVTFLAVLGNGVGEPNHPAIRLREKFAWLAQQPYKIGAQAKAALIKTAWNAFAAGEELTGPLQIPATLDIPVNAVTSQRWVGGEG